MDNHLIRYQNQNNVFIDLETFNLCLSFHHNRPWQAAMIKTENDKPTGKRDIYVDWWKETDLDISDDAARITKFNKKTTGGGVKPLKTVSNSLKRVISSGKKLKAGQFKQILAKMNPAYRQLVLKIKDVTKRNNVAKEWAKNNLLT